MGWLRLMPILEGESFWSAVDVDRLKLVCKLRQVRMSRDVAGDGNYLSGLASFASRTCYANSSGDHLVRRTHFCAYSLMEDCFRP